MKKLTNKKEITQSKEYWRSIDQLNETEADLEASRPEFPEGADLPPEDNAWSRRSFLSTIAASMALAGLSGCRRPVEKIVPYVSRPENLDPGTPLTYATTWTDGNEAVGILVRSNDGRPTHIEGNPLHPSSGGAVTPQIQASILDLYDPDRSRTVLHKGEESSWDKFVAFWKERHAEFSANDGAGLKVICEPFASPTKYRLMNEFKKKFPKAEWNIWGPNSDGNITYAARVQFSQNARPIYHYDKAKVILSLDCDFLSTENESITASAGFAKRRRVESKSDMMNRLYMVESRMSLTGTMADHRLRTKSGSVGEFLVDLANELIRQGLEVPGILKDKFRAEGKFNSDLLRELATDLLANYGQSLVVVGKHVWPQVHEMAILINEALGNLGKTLSYSPVTDAGVSSYSESKMSLVNNKEKKSLLVILGSNPAYNSAYIQKYDKLLADYDHTVHLSTHVNETSQSIDWHIPATHYMESWSDARAVDGTPSIVQPMIAPLFNGHSDIEMMSLLIKNAEANSHDLVSETWREILKPVNWEADWKRVLHDGLYIDKPRSLISKTKKVIERPYDWSWAKHVIRNHELSYHGKHARNYDEEIELVMFPDKLAGGEQSNNGWLQELPDPITKMVWDNAALISPKLAQSMNLVNGDIVTIAQYKYPDGLSIDIPVWITPGQAEQSVAIALGYGRKMNGRIADEVGVNVYPLTEWLHGGKLLPSITITPTGQKSELSTTQKHSRMEGRPLIRENSLEGYKKTGEFYPKQTAHPPLVPLWEPHKYDQGNQWGMTVDLNICNGCGGCTVACQSENNIPIVGGDQVNRGREMQWIRIDRYFAGDENDPEVVHQPVMCQHCENAPCETVCPVNATVHDSEGLNVMVYNRCIGTRYCSNNCPYKVRRFNFFNLTKDTPEVQKMGKNPEVTIRSRGVMEKCTYCVQRINKAKTSAKAEGRDMKDGDVVVACQAACPSKAITFGNIIDPNSEVAQMKKLDRNYSVLEELHTIPRTTYLAKLRNPNPKLVTKNRSQTNEVQG